MYGDEGSGDDAAMDTMQCFQLSVSAVVQVAVRVCVERGQGEDSNSNIGSQK